MSIKIITEKTYSGVIVGYARYNGYRTVKTYIKSRYNGKNVYTLDYAHARRYKTKQAVAAAVETIKHDINTGVIK